MFRKAFLCLSILTHASLIATHSAHAVFLQTGDLIVTDRERGLVLVIDPDSGEERVLSGGTIGDGPSLDAPIEVVVSRDRRVFVFGAADGNSVVEIDPASGDRWAVIGPDTEGDPNCCLIKGLSLRSDGALITFDRTDDRFRIVNADTGSSQLFGPYLGFGGNPADFFVMEDDSVLFSMSSPSTLERAYRWDGSPRDLFELLADSRYVGPGLSLHTPNSIAMSDIGLLYAANHGNALFSVLEFDLETGERRLVTASNRLEIEGWENPNERGEGPKWTGAKEIAVGLDGYLYATTVGGVLRIDPDSGDRETVLDRSGLFGLAVVPVPEPSSGILLSVVLAACFYASLASPRR